MAKLITMRDAPVNPLKEEKKLNILTTRETFKPTPEHTLDAEGKPKFSEPKGPFISTRNMAQLQREAELKKKMEKVREAKIEKIKEELQAKKEVDEKVKEAKPRKKAEPKKKKEPESPPEPISEEPKGLSIPDIGEKAEIGAEPQKTTTRKKYTTKKEKKD